MKDTELREPTYLLLTALAGGPRHGYALMQEVETISAGRVKLRAGTLYGALDRLTVEGLVTDAGEEVVDGRLRRYYTLTRDGAELLGRETRRLRANAAVAARRLRALGVNA